MKLKDYTILEYSKLPNVFDLDNLLKNLKPKNIFCNKEINILQQEIEYRDIIINDLKIIAGAGIKWLGS